MRLMLFLFRHKLKVKTFLLDIDGCAMSLKASLFWCFPRSQKTHLLRLLCSQRAGQQPPGEYEQTCEGVASEMDPAVVVGTVPGYTYSEPGSLAFLEIP